MEHGKTAPGANILSLFPEYDWTIKDNPELARICEKLFNVRGKRVHPAKDDKILTDWNGLMIAAMAKGYQVLGHRPYLDVAQKTADLIRNKLVKKGKLLHRYREGEGALLATLNDYAFLIYGLIELFEADDDPRWLSWGSQLQEEQDQLFWDEKNGGYFLTAADSPDLIVRSREFYDGVMPSGNSVAVSNLLRLNALTYEAKYRDRAGKLLGLFPFHQHPAGFPQALMALDSYLGGLKEVAVVGDEKSPSFLEMKRFLHQTFLPHVVTAMGSEGGIPLLEGKIAVNGQTTVYVCQGGSCLKPLTDLEESKKLILDQK